VYYVIAPAEASSNLSRFDGVRYGHRAADYKDLADMYKKSRAEGFGDEVKRRILVGTYVLSHGYYDAYYLQAQKIRRLIAEDFQRALAGENRQCDVIMGPVSPTVAWDLGDKTDDPVANYLADIFTCPPAWPACRACPFLAASAGREERQASGRPADHRQLFRRGAPAERGAPVPAGHRLAPARTGLITGPRHQQQHSQGQHHAVGSRHRPRNAHAAFDPIQDLQRQFDPLRRRAQHPGQPVDLALPGVLPVLNKGAVERAIQFGLAIGATIAPRSVFARKNYFYPDLPKGYQISQFEIPVVQGGTMSFAVEKEGKTEIKTINLTRAHLEEDAGKSLHEDYQGMTGIDLNRAGTPLLEIVTEPDMRSAAEAVGYAKALHSLVVWLGICDGNMQEGSFRCDANVSVRPVGQEKFGTRCEIKNLNSFRFLEEAINYEVRRQIELIEDGGTVVQETRLYDPDKKETRSMRSKEDAQDYRYFPDPDLPPLAISQEWIERVKTTMPELPGAMRERFVAEYALPEYDAMVLTQSKGMASYFEAVVAAAGKDQAKPAANWLMGDVASTLNREDTDIADAPVKAAQLALLLKRIADGTISNKIAKEVFAGMWEAKSDKDAWPMTSSKPRA
jgi:aspartyl-tRNA(Asn)/glutamyl-tRNA(Gln) amidotransferase subunit B